jgi:hypothetical protein
MVNNYELNSLQTRGTVGSDIVSRIQAAVLSTGLVTSPCLQNLAFQILAMAKMQTVGNNEERFVLTSLKEFVKTWGTGGVGSFQLDC